MDAVTEMAPGTAIGIGIVDAETVAETDAARGMPMETKR